MEALKIDTADIGLPGAGGTHAAGVERLAREIVEQKMNIRPNCAARTHRNDIQPIADISQRAGIPIEACTFLGSSFIRFFAEGWTLDKLLALTEDAVTFAVSENLPVMFVTEDTTRADPETIRALYTTAIRCGAKAVCVCDTVGHATPDGARAVVSFVKKIIDEQGGGVRLDWHGHQDRGLGVINSIAAIEGGADQVHGSALGLGERVGNTPMDQLLVNLKLLGWIDNDLSMLREYCEKAAESCGWNIPVNYPVFGRDAFRTATGVHAAAVIKSFKKGDNELADLIYSGVPAHPLRHAPDHRGRPDERQVKRRLLARVPRHRGDGRPRAAHLRPRQERARRPERGRDDDAGLKTRVRGGGRTSGPSTPDL
jgi:2-isopropylmalate synthase